MHFKCCELSKLTGLLISVASLDRADRYPCAEFRVRNGEGDIEAKGVTVGTLSLSTLTIVMLGLPVLLLFNRCAVVGRFSFVAK